MVSRGLLLQNLRRLQSNIASESQTFLIFPMKQLTICRVYKFPISKPEFLSCRTWDFIPTFTRVQPFPLGIGPLRLEPHIRSSPLHPKSVSLKIRSRVPASSVVRLKLGAQGYFSSVRFLWRYTRLGRHIVGFNFTAEIDDSTPFYNALYFVELFLCSLPFSMSSPCLNDTLAALMHGLNQSSELFASNCLPRLVNMLS